MTTAVAAPAGTGEPEDKGEAAGGGQGGSVNATWRDALPDDLKAEKTLEKFVGKDWSEVGPTLAKSYVNLEKMPRGVTPPKDGAPQVEWDAFYEKLGRPKTVDEYGLEVKVPDGMQWNKQAETRILTKMHARGLTKAQAQGVIDDYLSIAAEGMTAAEQGRNRSIDEAAKAMQQEWGGLYEQNIALVQRMVQEFGDEDFKAYLDDTGLGNDPRFLRWAYAVGRPMLEDNLIKGDGLGVRRADAKAEIEALMKTKEYQQGDRTIIDRILTLTPIAHGE